MSKEIDDIVNRTIFNGENACHSVRRFATDLLVLSGDIPASKVVVIIQGLAHMEEAVAELRATLLEERK